MKLKDFIENRQKELLESKTYKQIAFKKADGCKISDHLISYMLCQKPHTDMEIEVEEVNFQEETTGEIKGLMLHFDVIRPRHRKTDQMYLYVKPV